MQRIPLSKMYFSKVNIKMVDRHRSSSHATENPDLEKTNKLNIINGLHIFNYHLWNTVW